MTKKIRVYAGGEVRSYTPRGLARVQEAAKAKHDKAKKGKK